MKLPRRKFLHLSAGAPASSYSRALLGRKVIRRAPSRVIVENVSGAGGSIGVGRVARAAPDGYTVSIGHWEESRDQSPSRS
jgi:tripartite-type tricarboxylate transporter receptor subunit TctC